MSALNHQTGGDHYNKRGIQPFEYSEANRLPWGEGEIVKYTTRHEDKGGAEDLQKAMHIMQMILESRYGTHVPIQWNDTVSTPKTAEDSPHALCDCGHKPLDQCSGFNAQTDYHRHPDCILRGPFEPLMSMSVHTMQEGQ